MVVVSSATLSKEGRSFAASRSIVAGRFALFLDGVFAGWLQSVEGGNATADVVKEALGPSLFNKKHLGSLKYEDITIQLGLSMTSSIYDWITASWSRNYTRKNGSIIGCDFEGNALWVREFFDALITETTIPAADAASKDPGYMTLKLAPEFTRFTKADGQKISGDLGKGQQTVWLPSNFRLEIDGLDCTRANKVESITIKQTLVTNDTGEERDHTREPGEVEFPNLKITISEVGSESWWDYFEDFVIGGNNAEANEKSGALVFLSPSLQEEILRIGFLNIGVFRMTPDKFVANEDKIRHLSFELYCERMEFIYPAN